MKFYKSLYIHSRFFAYISGVAALFLISYWIQIFYNLAWVATLTLVFFIAFDLVLLYKTKNGIHSKRNLPDKFSNSDENQVAIFLENNYAIPVFLSIVDELPIQFQKRDFEYTTHLKAFENETFQYAIIPFERGLYFFGNINVYASTSLKIFARKYQFDNEKKVAVYPSYIQMKKYEFLAMSNQLTEFGLKKIRRIGHTMEFEKIKNYIAGDDVRTINWKATAKRGALMINQYQDEKSQTIYSIIDTSRAMKMPFEKLKLLDYAINATLAFSNIALLKNDKVGMMTFAEKVDNVVAARNKKTNLSILNEVLYNVNTEFNDADFGFLNGMIKRKINQRSLLILYTNFEHISALKRQLPYLKSIAKKHLLVTVFFENTALDAIIKERADDLQGIYYKTIAEKFSYEKRLIVKELEKSGVHSILTKPSLLSVNVINKYLEFKSKGLI